MQVKPHTAYLLTAIGLTAACDVVEAQAAAAKTVKAVRTETPPTIDGQLDEPCWDEASVVTNFVLIRTKAPAAEQTTAYVLYDETALYLGFRCSERRPQEMKAKFRNHDASIWFDDSIEVFLDTNLDRETYFQFLVNSVSARAEHRKGARWEGEWRATVVVRDDCWTAEMALPFAALRITPDVRDAWGINFCRNKYTKPAEHSCWSYTGQGFGNPKRFGHLSPSVAQDLATKRFNTHICFGADPVTKPETSKRLLDNGLGCIAQLFRDGFREKGTWSKQMVERAKASPALFAHFLKDEPDASDQLHKGWLGGWAMELEQCAAFVRQADPYRPTFNVIDNTGRPANYFTYGELTDLVCTDPYVMMRKSVNDLPLVREATRLAYLACRPRSLSIILWIGGGTKDGTGRFSTPAELRTTAYCALGEGAKGISYFGYEPGSWAGCKENAELWSAIGELNRDLHVIGPVVSLAHPMSIAKGSDENLWVRTLVQGNENVVVVVANDSGRSSLDGFTQDTIGDASIHIDLPAGMLIRKAFLIRGGSAQPADFRRSERHIEVPLGDVTAGALLLLTTRPRRASFRKPIVASIWHGTVHHAVRLSLGCTVATAAVIAQQLPQPGVSDREAGAAAEHRRVKERYIRFLIGTDQTFHGALGAEVAARFVDRVEKPIGRARAFDYSRDAGAVFRGFEREPGFREQQAIYSPMLQQYLLALAYGYRVNAPGSPYYRDAAVLALYTRCLEYLHGRGIRAGMTFHNNKSRLNREGAPRPTHGAANLVKMELRMGAYCQSVLLMEPYFRDTPTFAKARALVRHLEMLGKTSGHSRYYEAYANPPAFKYRVQSDAIQNYSDTTVVSALLEQDSARREAMLIEAKRVFTDSLKCIPGWADTIKPDFTGFHHRGIYGNAYTGGFIPQAAFGVYLLRGTRYAVEPSSVENLKQLMLTYRLYCQTYAMPFGIRGRMPVRTYHLQRLMFPGLLIYASALGLDDAEMKSVFARLWSKEHVGVDFLFTGGRGKIFRGMYALDMLHDLEGAAPAPEPHPNGFWYKPYGGLAIHRRDDWMAAVKGFSKYVWDYENGDRGEDVYGQCLSHGMLTIFSRGDPVSDVASGYRLDEGWDWYRLPGTTAVHFPIQPRGTLEHRRFSPETFLGGVSVDGENGVFGMVLNQKEFGDGTRIDLRANKSVFFMDDLIVLLGSGISGGDGTHPVETTLFQSFLPEGATYEPSKTALVDPAGNAYHVPDTTGLCQFQGRQKSYQHNGRTPSEGNYAVAWIDHGLRPQNAGYEVAVTVHGAARKDYRVVHRDNDLHQVHFPNRELTGYVFFRPLAIDDPLLLSVDRPCLVMVRETTRGLRLGVVNPDLGLLPPDAKPPTFRFIAANENQYLPSQPRAVDVALNGRWRLQAPQQRVAVVSQGPEKTVFRFDCLHGMGVRVGLIAD